MPAAIILLFAALSRPFRDISRIFVFQFFEDLKPVLQ